MRDQRKVSDYLHPRPEAPAGPDRPSSPVDGSDADHLEAAGPDTPTEGAAPASIEEMRTSAEEEKATLGELEELAGMLRSLHATMDTAISTVASARQEYEAQETAEIPQKAAGVSRKPSETLLKAAETPPPPPPRPQPGPARAPESRWRKSIVVSGVGVSAGAVLLVLLGWLWHANSALDPESVETAGSDMTISLDPVPVEPSSPDAPPRAASSASGKTDARAPMAAGMSEAGGSANAAPAGTGETPPQARLAQQALRGVAGEPVPLGIILLPEAASVGSLSVAVEGVAAPATITGGTRLGGETWMVDASQAGTAALLTPATYPGGDFRMNVRLVSNDGTVTPGRPLTVSVEQSQAFAAPPAEAAPASDPPPAMIPISSKVASAVAASGPAGAGIGIGTEAQPQGAQPAMQPLLQEEEVASAQPASPPSRLVGQPTPDAPQSADATSGSEQQAVPADAAPLPAPEPEQAEPSRTEPVTTYVNMRAEPSNDAAVLLVVPAGKPVGVIQCDQWCEVTYAGKHGWIHKRFVGERRSSKRPAPVVLSSAERRVASADPQRAAARSASERGRTGRTAPVTADANMRSRPSDDAGVVTVVPAGGQVGVIECRKWCEVSYAGKRGWIHSGLIGQATTAERSSEDKPRKKGFWKKILPF